MRPHVPRLATALSGCAHLVLLLILTRLAVPLPTPRAPDWAVPLVFLPASAPPAPLPLASATLPASAPHTETLPLSPAPPARVTAWPRHAAPRPAAPSHPAMLPAHALAAPPGMPVPLARPNAVPTLAPVQPDLPADFTSRIQAAVQSAATYPQAARLQRRQGRVRVSFTFADGAALAPAVSVSSSEAMLDRAALRAVAAAAYPPPPPVLGHAKLRLLVWVDFHLSPES